jgi:hypothetical protein
MLVILAALAFCAPAQAQKVYTQAELDALLAPIALQPDGVVSQVLIAATYPEDVAAAAAWSRANPYQRGDAAVRAVEQEPWDPAVKSLLAFPELLARMDESPEWLRDLGEAFLGQQAQVMDTVQGLRRRAQANGQLATTNDTSVYQQGEAIVVQPRTEIVYVRYYDPHVVYGPWWWGPYYHPVVWRPWRPYPVVVARGFFYSQPDWHHHHVRVMHRPVHAHHHHPHIVPGKWQHRPYVRVPESQRRPIVQQKQPMPAANGFSQHRDPVRTPPRTHAPQGQQHSQPQHGQPQHGQPQHGQPQHGQPQHGQPQHGQSQQHGKPQPSQQHRGSRAEAPRREQRAVEPRRQAEQRPMQRGHMQQRGQAQGGREQRGHRG